MNFGKFIATCKSLYKSCLILWNTHEDKIWRYVILFAVLKKSWSKIYKFLKRTPFLKPADNDPPSEISWEELANQAALFDLGLNEELDEETEKLVRDFETNFEGHLLKVFIGHKSINLRKS